MRSDGPDVLEPARGDEVPDTPCRALSIDLAGVVDGSSRLDRSERRHVERCLRCQAELAQYRKLLRAMQALRKETATPAPGLLGEVLAAVEAAGERQAVRSVITGRRVAYFGGIAAATAAGAAGAIVLAARSRKGRLPLAG